jgi:hypothetical protein
MKKPIIALLSAFATHYSFNARSCSEICGWASIWKTQCGARDMLISYPCYLRDKILVGCKAKHHESRTMRRRQ